MNQDQIKAMLLDIEESQLEFSVILTGKESKRVNGLYKPDTCEILLHNRNFTSDNQLIYTAIHEYAHHLLNEEKLEHSLGCLRSSRISSTFSRPTEKRIIPPLIPAAASCSSVS